MRSLRWLPFTLITSCIVAIVAVLTYMAYGGYPGSYTKSFAYETARTELQNAIRDYQNKNNRAIPILNTTVTINGSAYHIIDICPLIAQNKTQVRTFLDCLWSGNGSNNDNCDSGCSVCSQYHSYIWAVDENGIVHSTCVGQYCNISSVDGYQGSWP